MALKCFNCKAEIETGKKFCSDCGASIELEFPEDEKVPTPKANNSIAKVLVVLAIFGVVFYGAYSIIGSGIDSGTSSFAPDATPAIPEASGGIGDQVSDGQMTFLLNSEPKCFENGNSKLCRFDLSVFNHSKTAATFFDSVQKLVDADGNFYDAAQPYMRDDYSVDFSMKELNPGMGIRGYLFYELPSSISPTKLVLHDSMFSSGTAVDIQ